MELEAQAMDLTLIGAFATGVAVFSLLMALLPDRAAPDARPRAIDPRGVAPAPQSRRRASCWPRRGSRSRRAASAARAWPRPLLLALLGLLLSPVMALVGAW